MKKAWFSALLCGAAVLAANAAFAEDPPPSQDAPTSQIAPPSQTPRTGQLFTSFATADEISNLKPDFAILDQRPVLADCVEVAREDQWCSVNFTLKTKGEPREHKLFVRMKEFSPVNDSTLLYESRPASPGEGEIPAAAGEPGQYQWRDIPVLHDIRMWFKKAHIFTSPMKSEHFSLVRKAERGNLDWCVALKDSGKCVHALQNAARVAQKAKKAKGASAPSAPSSTETVKTMDAAIAKLFPDPTAQAMVQYDIYLETSTLKGAERKKALAALKKELVEAANAAKDEDRQKIVDKWTGKTGKVKTMVTGALDKPGAPIADFLKTLNDKTKKNISEDNLLAFYCPDIPAESAAPPAGPAASATTAPAAPASSGTVKASLPQDVSEVPGAQRLTTLAKDSREVQETGYNNAAANSGAVAGGAASQSSELREKCRKWNKEHVPPTEPVGPGNKNKDIGKAPPAPKKSDPNALRDPIAGVKLGIYGSLLAMMGPWGLGIGAVALVTVLSVGLGTWMSKQINK